MKEMWSQGIPLGIQNPRNLYAYLCRREKLPPRVFLISFTFDKSFSKYAPPRLHRRLSFSTFRNVVGKISKSIQFHLHTPNKIQGQSK
jgi:hypothetical protein